MATPIAKVKIPKDHPMLAGHKPGDMFQLGAMVPTNPDTDEGAEAGEEAGETAEGNKGHVMMHVTNVEKAPAKKPAAGKKGSPMDYLKSRQK